MPRGSSRTTACSTVTVRAIWRDTVKAVVGSYRAIGIYFLVFVPGGAIAEMLADSDEPDWANIGTALDVAIVLASIFGTYLLTVAMLRRARMPCEASLRGFLLYFAQTIVGGLGIILGTVLLVVPGAVLAARWAVSAPLLVGRGEGALRALGTSWRLTRGHTSTIVLAGLPLLLPLAATIGTIAWEPGTQTVLLAVLGSLAEDSFTVLATALSVALLDLLDPAREMEEIFA